MGIITCLSYGLVTRTLHTSKQLSSWTPAKPGGPFSLLPVTLWLSAGPALVTSNLMPCHSNSTCIGGSLTWEIESLIQNTQPDKPDSDCCHRSSTELILQNFPTTQVWIVLFHFFNVCSGDLLWKKDVSEYVSTCPGLWPKQSCKLFSFRTSSTTTHIWIALVTYLLGLHHWPSIICR